MNLGSSALLALACRIGSVALAAAFRFYLAIYLGPEDQAHYYSFLHLSFLIAAAGGLGLGQAAAYYLAHERATARGAAAGTFHLTLVTAMAASALSMPLMPALLPQAYARFGLGLPALIGCASLGCAVASNGQGVMLGMGRNGWAILPMLALNIVNIIVFVALAASPMPPLQASMRAYCVSAGCIALAYYAAARVIAREGSVWFGPLVGKRMSFGAQNALSAFLSLALFRTDFFMVSRMCKAVDAGAYSFAEMASELLWFAPDAVALVLLPHAAAHSDAELREQAPRIARMTLAFSCGLALAVAFGGVLTLTPPFVAYRSSLSLILMMLPGACAIAAGKIYYAILASRAKLAEANIILAVAIAATAAIALGLVPLWGPDGAACAASIAAVVCATAMAWRVCRRLGWAWSELILIRKDDIAYFRAYLRETAARFTDRI